LLFSSALDKNWNNHSTLELHLDTNIIMTIRQLPSTLLILKFTALLQDEITFREKQVHCWSDMTIQRMVLVTPRFAFKYKTDQ
jgi:hypothetical protein